MSVLLDYAQLLTTAGDNPDRLRSEAALAHLSGTAPIPASSGRVRRHRLHRGGDRDANHEHHRRLPPALRPENPRLPAPTRLRGLEQARLKRYLVRADFAALTPIGMAVRPYAIGI